jgi:PAS domain S-box-containing protein
MPRTYRELERANETLTSEIMRRKKMEREYGQTFELSSRGMVQISPESGRILRANERLSKIMGYPAEEILQMNATNFWEQGEAVTFSQFIAENLENGGSNIERQFVRKDGNVIWTRTNAIMIRDNDGKPLHVVATIDDITQRKLAETQIDKLNRDLSHLARGKLLGQLAAGLAHELNQPLTAITQNADAALLTARDETEQNDELIQILKELDQQAHRAADIIKALRSFARKGEEWKTPFDLAELIGQTLRLVQPEATEHGVELTVDCANLPQVLGIRVQIAQVLVNLLRNAIEAIAGNEDSKKKIQVTAVLEGDFVKVSVSDTGPGVDQELDLFAQFETTKSDGMGLGLSICRSIVEAGGGKIWYETNDDNGARFCFVMPKAP